MFVETSEFTDWVAEYLPDDTYAQTQQELMDNPDKGDAMPGCGGLRKLRAADPGRGKGKRGGARIIYLYVPEVKRFFLLMERHWQRCAKRQPCHGQYSPAC